MCDQVGEQTIVCISHERQRVNEELELVNEQFVDIKWASEVQLDHTRCVVVTLVLYHLRFSILTDLLVISVNILEETELRHDLKVGTPPVTEHVAHVSLVDYFVYGLWGAMLLLSLTIALLGSV